MVESTCAGSAPQSQEQFAELLVVSPRGLPQRQRMMQQDTMAHGILVSERRLLRTWLSIIWFSWWAYANIAIVRFSQNEDVMRVRSKRTMVQ